MGKGLNLVGPANNYYVLRSTIIMMPALPARPAHHLLASTYTAKLGGGWTLLLLGRGNSACKPMSIQSSRNITTPTATRGKNSFFLYPLFFFPLYTLSLFELNCACDTALHNKPFFFASPSWLLLHSCLSLRVISWWVGSPRVPCSSYRI